MCRNFTLFQTFATVCLVLATILQTFAEEHEHDQAHQEVKMRIFENYDKNIRPNVRGPPVKIGVSMYIIAVLELNEKEMTFTTSSYFRQTWNDTRLKFELPNVTKIQLQGDDIGRIWEPDTFVVNEVRSFQHQTFVPNDYVRIDSTGNILKSSRYTITASCPMDFQYFPFDSNTCALEIESYGFTMADVQYTWAKGADSVGISADSSLPAFTVKGFRLNTHELSLTSGNYSRLMVYIEFDRVHGRYMSRFFLPLLIFVFVSLLSLWVLTEKMALVLNFLNIPFVFLFMGTVGRDDLPGVSYMTALDLYFIICFLHMILCFIDSAVANFLLVLPKSNQALEMTSRHVPLTDDVETLVAPDPTFAPPRNELKRKIGKIFDFTNIFVKIGLLGSFLLCNFVYCTFYSGPAYHDPNLIPLKTY